MSESEIPQIGWEPRPYISNYYRSPLQRHSRHDPYRKKLHILHPAIWNTFKSRLNKDTSNGIMYDVVHFDLHGEVKEDNKCIPKFNIIDITFQTHPLIC